jgi:hypothetical protein
MIGLIANIIVWFILGWSLGFLWAKHGYRIERR